MFRSAGKEGMEKNKETNILLGVGMTIILGSLNPR